jgi:hypothetical protein
MSAIRFGTLPIARRVGGLANTAIDDQDAARQCDAAGFRAALMLAGALSCEKEAPDSIDAAILAGFGDEAALAGHEVLHLDPFDPVRKRAAACIGNPGTLCQKWL